MDGDDFERKDGVPSLLSSLSLMSAARVSLVRFTGVKAIMVGRAAVSSGWPFEHQAAYDRA